MGSAGEGEAASGPRSSRDEELLEHLADAMADPFRARLLAAVNEHPGVSIREIAGWIGETDRKVRYHIEALTQAGLIEAQGEVRRRGATERQYRASTPMVIGDPKERRIPSSQERRIALEVLKMMMADATASVASGHFGTRDGHCETRLHGEVDEQGWQELAALFLRMTEETHEILRRSVERRRETGKEGVEVTGALLLFEAPTWNREK